MSSLSDIDDVEIINLDATLNNSVILQTDDINHFENIQINNFISKNCQEYNDITFEEQNFSYSNNFNFSNDYNINQRETLIMQISDFQYECTICYVSLQPGHPIWSCGNCFHIFHINCIQKWHSTCVSSDNNKWRCPTCQNEYCLEVDEITYYCFCGKIKNPEFKPGNLLHSCGEVCSKTNRTDLRCPHFCSIQCHPGPCPPCEASLSSKCFCLKTSLTVKCNTSENSLRCGKKCEKLLNCLKHSCQMFCHSGSCDSCIETIVQCCYCRKEIRSVICGSLEASESSITCNSICNKIKDCGNHKCEKKCHIEPCDSCIYLPSNVKCCPCGKTKLDDLLLDLYSYSVDRKSCLDEIPTCNKICTKTYSTCEHTCPDSCHQGNCQPCRLVSNIKCCCRKTVQKLKCSEVIRLKELGKVIECKNRCKIKKNCGIHRCNEFCCDKTAHVCEKICGKVLSCQMHSCSKTCHRGACPTCSNVSFEELFCACGMEVILPPIACGQSPPACRAVCSREHSCFHDVRHNCHSESECPPCTVLTSKYCPGMHMVFDNVPCFRPVVTCGFPCNKPLPNCQHSCIKDCHFGNCTSELFQCSQLCKKPRTQCQHPCSSLCHIGDCQTVFKLCSVKIDIKCACNHKSASLICHKLEDTRKLLESKNELLSTNGTFVLSGSTIVLICDNDCKKASRVKQNMETVDRELINSENLVYTSFLRDFSTSDPNFLLKIDDEFTSLIRKLETNKLKKIIHRFEPMNRNKRRFIHELSKYFGLNSISCDPDPKRFVTIEAVRGISKIPQIRLLTFMQKNYPNIFKTEKQISLKFMIHQNSMN